MGEVGETLSHKHLIHCGHTTPHVGILKCCLHCYCILYKLETSSSGMYVIKPLHTITQGLRYLGFSVQLIRNGLTSLDDVDTGCIHT